MTEKHAAEVSAQRQQNIQTKYIQTDGYPNPVLPMNIAWTKMENIKWTVVEATGHN